MTDRRLRMLAALPHTCHLMAVEREAVEYVLKELAALRKDNEDMRRIFRDMIEDKDALRLAREEGRREGHAEGVAEGRRQMRGEAEEALRNLRLGCGERIDSPEISHAGRIEQLGMLEALQDASLALAALPDAPQKEAAT